jgi:hypothetical protein
VTLISPTTAFEYSLYKPFQHPIPPKTIAYSTFPIVGDNQKHTEKRCCTCIDSCCSIVSMSITPLLHEQLRTVWMVADETFTASLKGARKMWLVQIPMSLPVDDFFQGCPGVA